MKQENNIESKDKKKNAHLPTSLGTLVPCILGSEPFPTQKYASGPAPS